MLENRIEQVVGKDTCSGQLISSLKELNEITLAPSSNIKTIDHYENLTCDKYNLSLNQLYNCLNLLN